MNDHELAKRKYADRDSATEKAKKKEAARIQKEQEASDEARGKLMEGARKAASQARSPESIRRAKEHKRNLPRLP